MTIYVINSQVILIEPYFDCYVPQISVAGGIPKFVPLRPVSTYMYTVTLSFSHQFKFKSLLYLHRLQKENASSTKDWILDKEELESTFSEKTRAIVINTPHNPVGKVKIQSDSVQTLRGTVAQWLDIL